MAEERMRGRKTKIFENCMMFVFWRVCSGLGVIDFAEEFGYLGFCDGGG